MPVYPAPGGRLVVEFRLRGVRVHRRCPPGTTRAQADELENRLRREIFEQRDLGRRPVVPLPAAVQFWLAERVAGRKAERETRNHAHALADLITNKTLDDLVAVADRYRRTPGLAAATVNRRLCILKAVGKFAYRKGWLAANPSEQVPLLPEHNARHIYLSAADVRRLLAAISDREARAFVALAVYTGMRRSELSTLRRDQIGPDAIDLGVNTKTGAPRRIPVIAQARPFLRFVPFESSHDRLTAHARRALRRIGLGHVHFHDLRHTTASLLIQHGVDLHTVGRILGHSTPATTARYAHLSDEALHSAMGRLSTAIGGRKSRA